MEDNVHVRTEGGMMWTEFTGSRYGPVVEVSEDTGIKFQVPLQASNF
jgi:hypothetical protein